MRRSWKRRVRAVSADLFGAAYLALAMLFERRDRERKKVLFFGPALITQKYITRACRLVADCAHSFVREVYSINDHSDFDFVSQSHLEFLRQLTRHNIYLIFYDSLDAFLGPVSQWVFTKYKKRKKKKLIVMPYGSDATLYSRLPNLVLRHSLNIEYSGQGLREGELEERYYRVNRHADFRIGCIVMVSSLSTWDILPVHYYGIDLDKISTLTSQKYETFTIVHSPNHRGAKGTEYLLEAVQQLQSEGHKLELKLLEGVKNDTVLEELSKSHLLVEQLATGYGLSAVEGMALGLPVISNLSSDMHDVLRKYSYLGECPIVSAELDVADIKAKILYTRAHAEELSAKCRAYVEKYYSLRAQAVMWNKILESLETGERLINYFHPIIGSYERDYEASLQQ